MTNSLLRSGCPDDFLALGDQGQTVFDSAMQIRETLRLRKQQAIADVLAIPYINDNGDRIDWYSPCTGTITRWAVASETQRTAAVRHLEQCQAQVNILSTPCQGKGNSAQHLFSSLLAQALQFPGSQYVYLVGDQPVLTFWGFVTRNETPRQEVFACLRGDESQASDEGYIPDPTDIPLGKEHADKPESSSTTVAPQHHIAASGLLHENPPSEKVTLSHTRWLPACAVFAIFIALVSGGYRLVQPQAEDTFLLAGHQAEHLVLDVAQSETAPEALPATLPLMTATVSPPPEEITTGEPEVTLAISKSEESTAASVEEVLIIPANELKKGSTQFLDGFWQATLLPDHVETEMPLILRYQITDNQGTVSLLKSSDIYCQAEIYSGFLPSGTLMIKSRSKARCDDGTRHQLPEIACKAGIDDVAECTGRYDSELFPIIIKPVSH